MENKIFFEALDITLRDILRNKNENSIERPFGGMTMVVGEDFRQILPVLLKGRRHNIVTASIKRSYLRKHFHIMKLKRTLRLNSMSDDITVNKGQQNLQTGFSIFEMELIHHQKVKHFL
jgi:ATP-dependent DNA helicase PIF1